MLINAFNFEYYSAGFGYSHSHSCASDIENVEL